MSDKIKIFLVDDHNLFREGLRFLLSGNELISEIYEAENGKELLIKVPAPNSLPAKYLSLSLVR